MAFPTTGLLDNFNRANEMPLAQANWRDVLGAVVDTNRAEASADGTFYGLSLYDTLFGPDCDAYVTIPTIDPLASDQAIVYSRYDPDAENGYAVYAQYIGGGGTDIIYLDRIDAGVVTHLNSWNVTLADGDKIGIRCDDDDISAYYYTLGAWALLGTEVDATYAGTGLCGVWAMPDGGTGAIPLDDFGAGDETGAAFPEPGVVDNFNRPNTVCPPPSASWVDQYVMGVVGNECAARQTPNGYETPMLWRTSLAQDQEVYVTVPTRQEDGVAFYLCARWQNYSNNIQILVMRNDAGGDTAEITEFVADVETVIGGPYSITYQNGDAFGIQCTGATIWAWYKPVGGVWGLLGSGITTLPLAGGYIGLIANGTTIRFDDFGGGPIAGLGLYSVSLSNVACDPVADLMTLIAPADRRVRIIEIGAVGMDAATAENELQIARSTGGTTGGDALTPGKVMSEDQSPASSKIYSTWVAQPTLSDVLLRLPLNAEGGVARWRAKPRQRIELRDGEQLSLRPAVGTSDVSVYVIFEEL